MSEANQTPTTAGAEPVQQAAPPVQQAAPAPQQQLQLNTQPAPPPPAATPTGAGADAHAMAKMMADNEAMRTRLKQMESAVDKDESTKNQERIQAQQAQSQEAIDALNAQLATANANARSNAVKAHYLGSLKSDAYLQLVPGVEFSETGALSASSAESLNAFKQTHPELFNQATTATTPISASGANMSADGVTDEVAKTLRANRIALPGEAGHWSNRKNVHTFADILGHNAGRFQEHPTQTGGN